ncbi:MAG: TRAP transporter large permease [Burkholderiales bacterium]|nr:TRAP transporter large permease [Burkholderiales bacterium]
MSSLSIGIALFGGMLALMALRVPIAVAMFAPGAIGYGLLSGCDPLLDHLKGAAFGRFSVYDLSVIPLFLLMGAFAMHGGLSKALFDFANALLGRFRGGMAMAGILASGAFGSISGSSVATTATIAQVALPEMRRLDYSGRLATASLAAGGTLGILLPPSVTLMIYAILTEQNIAKLFLAAYIPGAIAALGYILAIAVTVRMYPEHAPKAGTRRSELGRSLLGVWPIAAVFLVVFGGIYGGQFTPVEGASIGAVMTFLIALLRGALTPHKIGLSLLSTAQTAGMLFMIFLGADMMNASLALSRLPGELAQAVSGLGIPPLAVLAGIMLFYVALGCVMDELSMIMLTIPVVFPVIMGLDFFGLPPADKALWFGILILMVVEIGMIFPPVGLNVYVMNGLARDVPMVETYKGVVPFLISDAIRMTLLILFPSLSLWLVGQFGR